MLSPYRAARAGSLALVVAMTLAGSLLLTSLAAPRPRAAGAVAPAEVLVTIENFTFSPATLEVPVGTTVRWVNQDFVRHDVRGVLNASTLRSPLLGQGEEYSFTFQLPGTYNYICSPHPYMTGEIRVVGATDGSVTFPETGFSVRGPFLSYWRAHGLEFGDYNVSYAESLALFGFPISEEREERLEDGRTYRVQYFERARFELHPENAGTEFEVLLGQFGRRLYPADPPAPRRADATYFPETGHNLDGRFRDFWNENGGLAVFGYPLSEEIRERLEDGREYRVQYFERARFELHPEAQAPYDVQLGQFGRRILAGR